MKKSIFIFITIVLFIFMGGKWVAAQYTEKDKLSDLLQRLILLSAALYASDYTIAHIEVDRIEKGESYTFERKLYSGNSYKIVGIGGSGIDDLDIKIYRRGKLIGKDTSTDNVPEVTIDIPYAGYYTIEVIAYSLEATASEDAEYYFVTVIGYK